MNTASLGQRPKLRPVVWLGNSKDNLMAFPKMARKLMGDQLRLLQYGGMPKNAKPFRGIGSGVIEIALRHDKEAYRTVAAVQMGQKIYVLHVFQKKARHGIATPQQDVELIRQRYREAQERAQYEQS